MELTGRDLALFDHARSLAQAERLSPVRWVVPVDLGRRLLPRAFEMSGVYSSGAPDDAGVDFAGPFPRLFGIPLHAECCETVALECRQHRLVAEWPQKFWEARPVGMSPVVREESIARDILLDLAAGTVHLLP